MAVMVYKPTQLGKLEEFPARSIAEIQLAMCDSPRARLYSMDGHRSVDVQCPQLLEAANSCMVLAQACDLNLVALGDVLDQAEHLHQGSSKYAQAYVKQRIPDPYWERLVERILHLAPDGSGTREALRYLLSTLKPINVLY